MPLTRGLTIAILLATTTVASAPAAAVPEEIKALLDQFSRSPGLQARFTEEKHIALLAEPLVNEGEIFFAPPDRLLRRVTKPSPSSMVIHGDSLFFSSEGESEEIDLGAHAAVRVFVESFLQILKGDVESLSRAWAMRFDRVPSGPSEVWGIVLEPLSEPVRNLITRIEVQGRGGRIDSMRVVEASGDDSVTTFHDVDLERTFSAQEIDSVFSVHTP